MGRKKKSAVVSERKLSATPLGPTGKGQRPKWKLEYGDVEVKLIAGSVWIVKRLCRGCLRYFWQPFEPNIPLRKGRCVDCEMRSRWISVAAANERREA